MDPWIVPVVGVISWVLILLRVIYWKNKTIRVLDEHVAMLQDHCDYWRERAKQ